jgi:apolipoprotein D and lipocalin family protein
MNHSMLRTVTIFIAMASMFSCKATQSLTTVNEVDINQYAGQWYEIARLPNSFEKGLECVTATYTLKKNDKIEVLNKGYSVKEEGKFKTAKGTAWVPDSDFPGRLKVRFFWPFAGDYFIISLDKNYRHALVGDPSRKYLWVLARSKSLSDLVYAELLETARNNGFEIDNLIRVNQDCN